MSYPYLELEGFFKVFFFLLLEVKSTTALGAYTVFFRTISTCTTMYQYRIEVLKIDSSNVLPSVNDVIDEEKFSCGSSSPSFTTSSSFSITSCSASDPPRRAEELRCAGIQPAAGNEGSLNLRISFIRRRATLTCQHVPEKFILRSSPVEDTFFLSFYDEQKKLISRSSHRILIGGEHRQQGCAWVRMKFNRGQKESPSLQKMSSSPFAIDRSSSLGVSRTQTGVLRVGNQWIGECHVYLMWEVYPEDLSVFFHLPTDFRPSSWSDVCDEERRKVRSQKKINMDGDSEGVSEDDTFSFVSVNSLSFSQTDDHASLTDFTSPSRHCQDSNRIEENEYRSENVEGNALENKENAHSQGFNFGLPNTHLSSAALSGALSSSSSFHPFSYFVQSTTRLSPIPFPALSPPPPATSLSRFPSPLSSEAMKIVVNKAPSPLDVAKESEKVEEETEKKEEGEGKTEYRSALPAKVLPSSSQTRGNPHGRISPPPLWCFAGPQSTRLGISADGKDSHGCSFFPPTVVVEDGLRFQQLCTSPSPEEIERYRVAYLLATTRKDSASDIPPPPLPSASVLNFYSWKAKFCNQERQREVAEKGKLSPTRAVPLRKSALYMEMKEKSFKKMRGI